MDVAADRRGPRRIQGDGRRLPVRDATMDAVVSECVLSLMSPLDRALGEVRRVLRPGGRLGFTDFTATEPIQWVAPEVARWARLERPRSVAAWRAALTTAGLQVLEARNESWALGEIEARVTSRVDILGLLDALAAAGDARMGRAAAFLRQAQALRDEGTLGYHLFVAEAPTLGGPR